MAKTYQVARHLKRSYDSTQDMAICCLSTYQDYGKQQKPRPKTRLQFEVEIGS